jgi:predicted nucleotidyltransferase component of viral defense system
MKDWEKNHGAIIDSFVDYLGKNSEDYILKGGTALYLCYDLDRFSVDIDLDGKSRGLTQIVSNFCDKHGFSFRVAKDTSIVERCMIHYEDNQHPLKVEVSYRRMEIPENNIAVINGIKTYNIDTLCGMKVSAYLDRDKIRDLYDVVFLCNKYYDQLSPQRIESMRDAFEYKGVTYFDYITKTQPDELIDVEKLADSFLDAYDKLGLLLEEEELEVIEKNGLDAIPDDDVDVSDHYVDKHFNAVDSDDDDFYEPSGDWLF